ncbi:hypothetical protein [Lactococcus lactis]|uniref:hypothetical protein n=1 Tax=Lactococcus lactis TaxID=1358 RepID=UPI0001C052E2|nr:hypothetical protein [Lactococcus lactis]ADA64755.1 Phage protein [Lactococcus lactis subsp. lactis KF147]ADA65173.1 Phage protein [Lactococcus lactis subsp. lactis KF147]
MSEIENIARHIVRQEEERQVEKIKLESEIKALEEVLEHGISTEFVEEEVIYIYSPKTAHDMREKLEENYKQLHAQLTIPKSIAKKIDKFIKVLHFLNEFEAIKFLSAMDFNGDRTPQWLKDNPMLVFAYLAGKALGVDLVKVVEG